MEKNTVEINILRKLADDLEKGNDNIKGFILAIKDGHARIAVKSGDTRGLKTQIKEL